MNQLLQCLFRNLDGHERDLAKPVVHHGYLAQWQAHVIGSNLVDLWVANAAMTRKDKFNQ